VLEALEHLFPGLDRFVPADIALVEHLEIAIFAAEKVLNVPPYSATPL
jgi:hypothetical protein